MNEIYINRLLEQAGTTTHERHCEICDAYPTNGLTPREGTQVVNDAEALASGAISAVLREVLEQRGVLIFRDVSLSDAQ
jgi:hypothetical protein